MGAHLQGDALDGDEGFNPEINTTPLVDVMLVLLVIFMVTVPAIQHSVNIDLPQAAAPAQAVPPAAIDLALDGQGGLHWNAREVPAAALPGLFAEAATQQPTPELHLRAARDTPYEKLVQVMAVAQAGGIEKIGFVTQPQAH